MRREHWAAAPADHDYPAAERYLGLVMDESAAAATVHAMRRTKAATQRVNDVLRASRLPLLAASEPEVAKNMKKVRKGMQLSPVLLVRGDPTIDRPLIIADGYHRVCASYQLDPDELVSCVLVDLATAPATRSTATRPAPPRARSAATRTARTHATRARR